MWSSESNSRVSFDTRSKKLSWIAVGIRGTYKTFTRGSYVNLLCQLEISVGRATLIALGRCYRHGAADALGPFVLYQLSGLLT
jgi:hypothetical protein